MNQSMIFLLLLAAGLAPSAHAITGSDMDFHGYLRAGIGTNLKGGAQECFSNSGAPGNEFRLGNECGVYGETALRANLLKPAEAETKPFFAGQVRFSYAPDGYQSWEPTNFIVSEAFGEGGQIDGSPLRFWVGKRFYRSVDVHMNDWYYMEEMSGSGAGVSEIPLGFGKLAAAALFRVGSAQSDSGKHELSVLDVRLGDVKVGEFGALNFWGAYGFAPGGTSGVTRYVPKDGWLLGLRLEKNFTNGFNHFAVIRGTGLMEGINLYGETATPEASAGTSPERWRFVNHLTLKPAGTWAFHAIAATDLKTSGGSDPRGFRWHSIGARPVYFFSDHYQMAFEAGHSYVLDETEATGPRTLTRLTVAPQISLSRDIWSRPVLRLYYTRSFWNDANGSKVGTSYAGSNAGHALGFQTEIWF